MDSGSVIRQGFRASHGSRIRLQTIVVNSVSLCAARLPITPSSSLTKSTKTTLHVYGFPWRRLLCIQIDNGCVVMASGVGDDAWGGNDNGNREENNATQREREREAKKC